ELRGHLDRAGRGRGLRHDRAGRRPRVRLPQPRVHRLGADPRADGARRAGHVRGQVLQRLVADGAGERAGTGAVGRGRWPAEARRAAALAGPPPARGALARDDGAPGRIRTLDLPLRRRLLYPLSYWCTRPRLAGRGRGDPPATGERLERETGLEPATYSLEGCRSTD